MTMDRTDAARRYLKKALAADAKELGEVSQSADFDEAVEAAETKAIEAPETLVPDELPHGVTADQVADIGARLMRGEGLDDFAQFVTEAIIIPQERPAVLVQDDDFDVSHPNWPGLSQRDHLHANLLRAIPSIGRVNFDDPAGRPYAGTGFLVGPNLLMTNRHVAHLFTRGLGQQRLRFITSHNPRIGFGFEHDGEDGPEFEIVGVRMVHPFFDMALLETTGLENNPSLSFTAIEPSSMAQRKVGVIGYPAFDRRNPARVQNEVFKGIYYVKRVQPGFVDGRRLFTDRLGNVVNAATHDASTLGGNSGSAVIDMETGLVLGLHFAGVYLDTNYAVAAIDLAADRRLEDAGLTFNGTTQSADGAWDTAWARVEDEAETANASTASPSSPGALTATASSRGGGSPTPVTQSASGGIDSIQRVTIPIHIDITVGNSDTASGSAPATPMPSPLSPTAAKTEAMVKPFHDPIELGREGYDPDFLGVPVPIPSPVDSADCAQTADGEIELRYCHFSVIMHRARRLAMVTAANVDARPEVKRPGNRPKSDYTRKGLSGLGENDSERWFTDPRIADADQLPDVFFTKDRSAFHKGHLVRRLDVAWGTTYEEMRRANGDTYFTTNCSPQVGGFNRSNGEDNWGALETIILRQAKKERYCVFSGPVLDEENDPVFQGVDNDGATEVQIPQSYWKIVVAENEGVLEAFAFKLTQDLSDTPFAATEFAVTGDWVERMMSIAELEEELGYLTFPPEFHQADQFASLQADPREGLPGLALSLADAELFKLRQLAEKDAIEGVEEGIEDYGRFEGIATIELDDNGTSARLVTPLTYIDQHGKEWAVPVGAWLDGASIPRVLWTIVGSPFRGKYRNASIIHDHYCITKSEPWRDVHRMFYNAMRALGVGKIKAKIMYAAVHNFGPRWADAADGLEGIAGFPIEYRAAHFHEEGLLALVEMSKAIVADNPSLDEIDAMTLSFG